MKPFIVPTKKAAKPDAAQWSASDVALLAASTAAPLKIKKAAKRPFEPWDLVDMAPISVKKPKKVALMPATKGETPAKVRQGRSKQALLASGGKRVPVNLSAQAVADLEVIKATHGVDGTQAIILALRKLAG